MREHPVLHPDQEHHGELQALGRVQRHQSDDTAGLGLLVGDLVGIGDQGDLLQEIVEGGGGVEARGGTVGPGLTLCPCLLYTSRCV